jgi:hypothetical protein
MLYLYFKSYCNGLGPKSSYLRLEIFYDWIMGLAVRTNWPLLRLKLPQTSIGTSACSAIRVIRESYGKAMPRSVSRTDIIVEVTREPKSMEVSVKKA